MKLVKQGAEARVYETSFLGRHSIVKERFKKTYRHPILDEKLTQRRLLQEARAISRARKAGIRAPVLYHVNITEGKIFMEFIKNSDTARNFINTILDDCKKNGNDPDEELSKICKDIGLMVAKLHSSDIIHGDLTTSNLLHSSNSGNITVIDFGLSYTSALAEDKGVDLYVLERAFLSTHPNTENLFRIVLQSYTEHSDSIKSEEVIKKLDEVRLRGRKREMVG